MDETNPPKPGVFIPDTLATDAAAVAPAATVVEVFADAANASRPIARSGMPRKIRRAITIGLLLAGVGWLAAWACGILRVKTADGILAIETNVPHADVFIDGHRVTVTWNEGGKQAEVSVPIGEHLVEVKSAGYPVKAKNVTFYEGKRRVFEAKLEPLTAADQGQQGEDSGAGAPQSVSTTDAPTGAKNNEKSADVELANRPALLVAPFAAEEARSAQTRWAKVLGSELIEVNSIRMKLTLVPPGEFLMGSGESIETTRDHAHAAGWDDVEAKEFKKEHPQHRVRITQPFYLGVYEVTKGQFKRFVDATGYRTDAEKDEGGAGYTGNDQDPFTRGKYTWRNWGVDERDEIPAGNVSWNDAAAFCKWLSQEEGIEYRLPTEAEWEYACRAGTMSQYYSGDNPQQLTTVANVADATAKAKWSHLSAVTWSDGYAFASPVGQFKPNAFGLYDMHGNAEEWCADKYDVLNTNYYELSAIEDPQGSADGRNRVVRGGSWYGAAASSRSAYRNGAPASYQIFDLGFRVARMVGRSSS